MLNFTGASSFIILSPSDGEALSENSATHFWQKALKFLDLQRSFA